MKRRHKILILILTLVLLVVVGASLLFPAAAGSVVDGVRSLLWKTGQVDSQYADGEQGTAAYTGEHITIYQEELDRFVQRIGLTEKDSDAAKEAALRALAVREVLCYRAEQEGFPNDEEGYLSFLEENRKAVEASVNYEDMLAYFEGLGMTAEEYWEWAAADPGMRKEYYAGLYQEKLREDFYREKGIVNPGEDGYAQWAEYYAEYCDSAVAEENLQKADGQ